jgi:small-conductance mechanosensitive channel
MKTVDLIMKIWNQNDHWRWIAACAIALTVLALALTARRWMRSRYRLLAGTERVEIMELPLQLASKTSTAFLIVAALYSGISSLSLPPGLKSGAARIFTVVSFWQVGVWGSAAVLLWLTARRQSAVEGDRAAAGSLGIIGFVLRGLVWTLILLLALENLGVDVTALVAGLGVGGIAVALAVQNILGDLFASLSITLDRPFVVGDFVIVGDYMGNVEQIGVKSTRLRSLGGEQIIMSNADLLSSRVRNYGRMAERRVVFSLGVTYETHREKLKRIPTIIREAIERQEGTRFERSHFSKYGDFAIEFETVFHVLSPDYTRYMDIQQAIYFDVHEAFEREEVEFAYPTQKLWLAGEAADKNAEIASQARIERTDVRQQRSSSGS